MREVKVNAEKKTWLISYGSSQIEPNKHEKRPPQVQGAPVASRMTSRSHRRQRPHEIVFFFVFLAIELPTTSLFDVLKLESCDFGDFNNVFDVFNYEFELAMEYDLDVDDTIRTFNFCLTGVELAEFTHLQCDFNAALTATTIATIITNENEHINNTFECGNGDCNARETKLHN